MKYPDYILKFADEVRSQLETKFKNVELRFGGNEEVGFSSFAHFENDAVVARLTIWEIENYLMEILPVDKNLKEVVRDGKNIGLPELAALVKKFSDEISNFVDLQD